MSLHPHVLKTANPIGKDSSSGTMEYCEKVNLTASMKGCSWSTASPAFQCCLILCYFNTDFWCNTGYSNTYIWLPHWGHSVSLFSYFPKWILIAFIHNFCRFCGNGPWFLYIIFFQKLNTGEQKSAIHIWNNSSIYISSRKREQSNFCLVGTKTPKKPTTDNILSSSHTTNYIWITFTSITD